MQPCCCAFLGWRYEADQPGVWDGHLEYLNQRPLCEAVGFLGTYVRRGGPFLIIGANRGGGVVALTTVPPRTPPDYGRLPAGGDVATSFPNRPCSSPKGPAVKNRAFVGPAPAPFPKARAHRPSIATGAPLAAWSWPRSCSSPLPSKRSRSKALMWPSPKFPTSRFPPNCPKSAGARASPHGEFSRPLEATRRSRWPPGSKAVTNPCPTPATSSFLSAS